MHLWNNALLPFALQTLGTAPKLMRLKQRRKQLERKWRNFKLEIDRQLFKSQRLVVIYMINQAKAKYNENQILQCNGQKEVFKVVENLLHQKDNVKLPSHTCQKKLAQRFNDYFVTKISKIRQDLDVIPTSSTYILPNVISDNPTSLESFMSATEDEIYKLVTSSPSKSCALDPIPTWMLKEHIDILVPVITIIVNLSFDNAIFPTHFRNALVSPLLKKPSLDVDNLKNFRPVSNLCFISKIVEKAVTLRLAIHLSLNNLYEQNQSAYRKYHGTETALPKVHNDILCELDNKRGVFLILLDPSAAFDIIDHDILFKRLESIGVGGSALRWFQSYLCSKPQPVNINGTVSSHVSLPYGVPQGSVLGPILFTISSSPIASIARKHGLHVHA